MSEIWEDIEGYEGIYQVSNLGNVRSLPRIIEQDSRGGGRHTQRRRGSMLKGGLNSKGYLRVTLQKEQIFIHRLVAKVFIPNPENKPQVNHIDGDKLNNKAINLEWVDNSTNQKHGRSLGLITSLKGEDAPGAKLKEDDVIWILKHTKKGDKEFGYKPIARKFGVDPSHIKNIMVRKKWKHIQL